METFPEEWFPVAAWKFLVSYSATCLIGSREFVGILKWQVYFPNMRYETNGTNGTYKFPLQPHQKYNVTQYEELGLSYLTQMKDDYTTHSQHLTSHSLLKRLGFELGSERVNIVGTSTMNGNGVDYVFFCLPSCLRPPRRQQSPVNSRPRRLGWILYQKASNNDWTPSMPGSGPSQLGCVYLEGVGWGRGRRDLGEGVWWVGSDRGLGRLRLTGMEELARVKMGA